MNHVKAKEVFHGSRSKATLVAACSGLFIVVGLQCFRALGPHLLSYAFTVLGCVGLACAGGFSLQKVVITPVGIEKKPGGFSTSWEEVESWAVEDVRGTSEEDSFTRSAISLKVRGRRVKAKIYDSDAVYPGFDKLVAGIRRYSQKKERA